MVQLKKPEVREAILAGAFRLFSKHGYAATTLAAIAKSAQVSPGNVYIYFGSKLEILYAIYDPWLRARIEALEQELAPIRNPKKRVKHLLGALWRDIPAEENGFLNNIMQAISVTDPDEGYRSTLVQWLEERVSALVTEALPPEKRARAFAQASSILTTSRSTSGVSANFRTGRVMRRAMRMLPISVMTRLATAKNSSANLRVS